MKILSMSGFIPEHICDTVRFSGYLGEKNIAHYCGYASDFITQVLQDKTIDGVVFPKSCDSARIIPSYLSESEKFVYQLNIPPRGIAGRVDYFASSIRNYQNAVEAYYGIKIDNIVERIEKINTRNRDIMNAYNHIEELSYFDYIINIHRLLQLPLFEQEKITDICGRSNGVKRIFLIGSYLVNVDIINTIEQSGMKIVGDSLPESGRLVSQKEVSFEGDIYKNIAESILTQRASPTEDAFEVTLKDDMDEIIRKSVQGVIFVTQKYCEAYDYYYAAMSKTLESRGIPVLRVSSVDMDSMDDAALSVEAFADMI